MKLDCLDYLGISSHFSEEELMVQKTTNEFAQKEILPTIENHFKEGTFPKKFIEKFQKLAELQKLQNPHFFPVKVMTKL